MVSFDFVCDLAAATLDRDARREKKKMPTSTQNQALATMTAAATASEQEQERKSTSPAVIVLHIGTLFSWFDSASNSSSSKRIVVPRFGAEQVLAYLRETENNKGEPLTVIIVAPGEAATRLLVAVREDLSLAPLLEGLHVIVTAAVDEEEALAGLRQGIHNLLGESGNNDDNDQNVSISTSLCWPLLGALLKKESSENHIGTYTRELSSSNGSSESTIEQEKYTTVTMVIGIAPSSSSSPSCLSPPLLVAEIISQAQAGRNRCRNHDDPFLLLPPSRQSQAHPLLPTLLKQQKNLPDLSEVHWPFFGLPSLVVDVQNPPFLWPRDYERAAGPSREVEARWWDPQHGQLNLIFGRGVHVGNALEVVAAETRRRLTTTTAAAAEGKTGGREGLQEERMEGLESVFVTVRHDFGIMARLLADGYRIHHAAGGGKQIVLLRRFVKVEVPTAGTHICRSKVILFRRRKRGREAADRGTVPSLSQEQDGEEEEGGREGEGKVEVFLFRRRAKGIYKMPGGHVELKELAEEAAVREVWEETGYACRVVGMVALTERKDVGKKWGCSQLMFTFAAEWVESEMRLDDAISREGKWFLLEEVDAMVAKDSVALDPPLKVVWPAFMAGGRALAMPAAVPGAADVGPVAWFCHHPHCIDSGYETRKRCYMAGGEGGKGRECEVQSEQQQQQQVQVQQGGGQMPGGSGKGEGSGSTASTSSLSSTSSSSSSLLASCYRGNLSEGCNSLINCLEGGQGNDWEGGSSS